MRRRIVLGTSAAIVLVLVGQQLLVPRHVAGEIEERLERGGGSADVTVRAWPALNLLRGRGDELRVTGSGLRFDLDGDREASLSRLDDFDRVTLDLEDVQAGPVAMDRLTLASAAPRGGEYDLTLSGTATPRALARELGAAAGGALGGLIGDLATSALPGGGSVAVPVELRATLENVAGRAEVVEAEGSVAGFPGGPLTELVVGAVVQRL
jgi:hypothetical protein